jgi:DNA-binding GntR family transcriptional regulator
MQMAAAPSTPLPLARPTSGEQVAAWIRHQIVTGVLRRGDRVAQEDVARELGVSRIPVREALVALDREGWVTMQPHRGAFVHGVDDAWVRDHYEILGALYGLAAARAAVRGTDEELERLRALHSRLKRHADAEHFDATNHALMQHILATARAPRLVTALRAVTAIVPGNFFAEVPGTQSTQRTGIARVVRAIGERDGATSRAEMEALLERQGSAVVKVLDERGVIADEGS